MDGRFGKNQAVNFGELGICAYSSSLLGKLAAKSRKAEKRREFTPKGKRATLASQVIGQPRARLAVSNQALHIPILHAIEIKRNITYI
jgi:hypothetical protein